MRECFLICVENIDLVFLFLSRTTITTNLVFVLLLYTKGISGSFKAILSLPNMVLMNVMACRVFRKTRLSLYEPESLPTSVQFRFPLSVSTAETTSEVSSQRALSMGPDLRSDKERVNQNII